MTFSNFVIQIFIRLDFSEIHNIKLKELAQEKTENKINYKKINVFICAEELSKWNRIHELKLNLFIAI